MVKFIAIIFCLALSLGVVYGASFNLGPGDSAVCTGACPHPEASNVKSVYQNKSLCVSCHARKKAVVYFKPFNTSDGKSGHRIHLQKRDPFTKLNISCKTCHNY